jgi:carbonic anhydrase/acetyltransferase-like protein (isoleucine patch superfamily)
LRQALYFFKLSKQIGINFFFGQIFQSKFSILHFTFYIFNLKGMALIKECNGKTPQFGEDCWLAENSTIVGDVVMGDQCSVWFNAVVRGDVNSIRMGNKVNIQDGAVLHCTYQKTKVNLGNNVSIGHNALVHGCTVEDNVLIGMGAIVMDNCYIEANCIIAAGAVLLEGTRVEAWSIYAGVPAKKVKTLSPELFEGEVQRIANNYVMYSGWFKDEK